MTPYQYQLKPSPDGHSTLIDWNWNGILGEENVVADINYDHGTDIGRQYDVGGADFAPVLVTHGTPRNGRLLLLLPKGGALHLREWLGSDVDKDGDRWSAETVVKPSGIAGDVTAAYQHGATWVAYRTGEKVVMRRIVVAGEHPAIGPAIVVLGAAGQPTLAPFDGRLALLLWRSADRPIGLSLIDVAGREVTFEREEESNFASAGLWPPWRRATAGRRPCASAGSSRPIRTIAPGPRSGVSCARRQAAGGDAQGMGKRRGVRPRWGHAAGRPRRAPDGALVAKSARLRGTRPALPFQRRRDARRSTLVGQYITMQAARRETGTGWFSRPYCEPGAPGASAPGFAGSATTLSMRCACTTTAKHVTTW